jgi:hypothetical protein
MLDRERELIRQEPELAGAILCVALAVSLGAGWYFQDVAPKSEQQQAAKPFVVEDGPAEWRETSKPRDVLYVASMRLAYWGNPRIKFSRAPRRKVRGIVVHCNYPCPDGRTKKQRKEGVPFFCASRPPSAKRALTLVHYLHNGDKKRGGHFGYHVYIAQDGSVIQGAPLTRTTNHIKGPGSPMRRPGAPSWLSNSTTIGVSIVGACDPTYSRDRERVTVRAKNAAVQVVKAIQKKFNLPCRAIRGHGELQRDRWSVEGVTISRMIRDKCAG